MLRERRQEGFGEGVGEGEVNPWSNMAINLAEFRRTTMEISMHLPFCFLMSNWK